ncbi:MAG: hypothetical protein U9N59_15605 [Campylobacterota bacterium]|nr:hypothetical protein [Campylobacterota bacterium]
MENKLTIITTLVNANGRKIQIDRFINYHIRFNCKIIIVVPNDIKGISSEKENITIINCSKDTPVLKKFLLALEKTTTPYVSLIADDDFLGLDFTLKSIIAMDSNNYIVACDGLTIMKEEETGKRKEFLYSYKSYVNGIRKKINVSRKHVFRFQAENFNPSVIHGIIRTNTVLEAMKLIDNLDIPVNFNDRVFLVVLMVNGNIHFINSVSGIRSYGVRIMHNDPKLFNKTEIRPDALILDDKTVNLLLNCYTLKTKKMSSIIKAEMLYFLIKSTNALTTNIDTKSFKYKIMRFYMTIKSQLTLLRLSLFNKKIKADIKLAEYFFKNYSIKG